MTTAGCSSILTPSEGQVSLSVDPPHVPTPSQPLHPAPRLRTDRRPPRRSSRRRRRKLGLDLQGGVSLVDQGKPTSSSRRSRRMRSTARSRSSASASRPLASPSRASPARRGPDRQSTCPAVRTPRSAADQVGTTAQMYFYDWQPNLLDADRQTNPDTPQVNGRPARRSSGFYNAVSSARRSATPTTPPKSTNSSRERWYGFDKASQVVNNGHRQDTAADLWALFPGRHQARWCRGDQGPRGGS